MLNPSALVPSLLWKHFAALSAIPRISKHEQAAAAYVLSHGRSLGLVCRTDAAGNVCITKPATPGFEAKPRVILQAHLDMVPQKIAGSAHDFLKDPLKLIQEGDWVRADGTTLGADNGIGVATALAILEDVSLKHGPLSAVFTVEEEIGLFGAAQVPAEFLNGSTLINLDADNPEELIIGCAGALDLAVELHCRRQEPPKDWCGLELKLSGLSGGHSGADIHRGRANAILCLGRLLSSLGLEIDWRLSSLQGGDARNAIPRQATALIALPSAGQVAMQQTIQRAFAVIQSEYQYSDPNMALSLSELELSTKVLDWETAQNLLDFLRICPNGMHRFSDLQPGVVESSSNIGICQMGNEGPALVSSLIRSSSNSAKAEIAASISALARVVKAEAKVLGDYPGWHPAKESAILPLFVRKIETVFGHPPRIAVVHGGLECGLLKGTAPELDCISFGPVILDMHSPEERVQISSVAQFWEVLTLVLAEH